MRTVMRIATVVGTFIVAGMFTVTSALAGDYPIPPTVQPTTQRPPAPAPEAEVAFTGFRLTVWMALLAALVVIGVATLIAGRRRAARAQA